MSYFPHCCETPMPDEHRLICLNCGWPQTHLTFPPTPAGKLQMIHDLMMTHIPIKDDEGNIIGYESLIPAEQGRKLLEFPEDPSCR